MDPRLERRYDQLVRSHMQVGHELAPGIKSTLNKDVAFNQTQAAWRFLNNERCSLETLCKPLLKAAHELSKQECDNYLLVPHDWSILSYGSHKKSKKDIYNTFKKSVGYDLQSSLIISDQHGGPLALAAMNLKTKKETFSTYGKNLEGLTHLEELPKRIDWLESQGFSKPLVHIVDREADSVAFFRSMGSKNWLVRVNGKNTAYKDALKRKIREIAQDLPFSQTRTIEYKGSTANQLIAETSITITRPARPIRKGANGKRLAAVKGAPVHARLIVSRVVDNAGKELAIWYLLSNMPDVPAATIALWYYWRWSIENYFKLLKSAGMQLESWQQTTGVAIARRLLIASMACVFVWRIAHAKGPEAGDLRKILVRLSGRQMKWKKEFTYTSLCAGLWVLLSIEEVLANYDSDKIKSLVSGIFGKREFI